MVITPLLNPHEASTRGGSFIFLVRRRFCVASPSSCARSQDLLRGSQMRHVGALCHICAISGVGGEAVERRGGSPGDTFACA